MEYQGTKDLDECYIFQDKSWRQQLFYFEGNFSNKNVTNFDNFDAVGQIFTTSLIKTKLISENYFRDCF